MRYTILFIGLLALPLSATLFGQSLFDKALQLNKVYNTIDSLYQAGNTVGTGDEGSPPEVFFRELKEIYGGETTISDADIRTDFEDNDYLKTKVNLAYGMLRKEAGAKKNKIETLKGQQDSLFQLAINRSLFFYRSQDKPTLPPELVSLQAGRTVDLLFKLQEKVKDEHLASLLLNFLQQITVVNNRIERERQNTENNLLLSAESGSGLPFNSLNQGGTTTFKNFAPAAAPTGGSLQAKVIDGASKFIAERMREELSIAFFERFEVWAEKRNVKVLFPNTFSTLSNSATTDYGLMMQILRASFQRDLDALPFQIPEYLEAELTDNAALASARSDVLQSFQFQKQLEQRRKRWQDDLTNYRTRDDWYDYDTTGISPLGNPAYLMEKRLKTTDGEIQQMKDSIVRAQQAISRQNELLTFLRFGLNALEDLGQGTHPSALISSLNESGYELLPETSNIRPALLLIDVLSRSLLAPDKEGGTTWRPRQDLLRISKEKQLREIYFGLIQQEVKQHLRYRRNQLEKERDELIQIRIIDNPASGFADSLTSWRTTLEELIKESDLIELTMIFKKGTDPQENEAIIDEYAQYSIMARPVLESFKSKVVEDSRLDNLTEMSFAIGMVNMTVSWNNLVEIASRDSLKNSGTKFWEEKFENYLYLVNYASFNYLDPGEEGPDPDLPLVDQMLARYDRSANDFLLTIPELDADTRRILRKGFATYALDRKKYVEFDQTYGTYIREAREAAIQETIDAFRAAFIRTKRYDDLDQVRLDYQISLLDQEQKFLNTILRDKPRQFGTLINNFSQFTNQIDGIQAEFKVLRDKDKANLGTQEFVYFLKNSLDVVRLVFDVALPERGQTLDEVQQLTNNMLDAYSSVLAEDYNGLIQNIIPVATTLVESANERKIEAAALIGEKEKREAQKVRDAQLFKLREIIRYGAFLAEVVEAESSEEVKNAIRKIALPTGSYSIKRRSFGNISLQTYPGITGGWERISNNMGSAGAPNFGFTAPIGLAFSWGYRSKIDANKYLDQPSYKMRVDRSPVTDDGRFLNGNSGSLFFSLFDFGAIVLFRLDDRAEPLPEDVGFQQLFSPGVAYTHGLAGLPLAISGGLQVSPSLRKFGEAPANSFRLNLGVTVDLPLANFHTRLEEKVKKKKKKR